MRDRRICSQCDGAKRVPIPGERWMSCYRCLGTGMETTRHGYEVFVERADTTDIFFFSDEREARDRVGTLFDHEPIVGMRQVKPRG